MSQTIKHYWENSLAHLELLSKFVKPLSIYYIPESYRSPEWYEALKESSLDAIKRFIEEGFLVRPSLDELMEYKFTISDLKKFCAERGLLVSGKKGELVKRLITTDEPGMRKEVSDLQIVVCSDKGMVTAQAYLEMRNAERQEAERSVNECLKKRDFLQAVRVVAKYEEKQVFHRGLGIDWGKQSMLPNPRDTHILKLIFEEIPTIAIGVNQQKLEEFRMAAGSMHLWGSEAEAKRIIKGIESISEKYENLDFSRMLLSAAINKLDLLEYREMAKGWGAGKKYMVEINTCNDEHVCIACERLAKKKYPLFGDVPELPNPNCSHACRCGYTLDLGY